MFLYSRACRGVATKRRRRGCKCVELKAKNEDPEEREEEEEETEEEEAGRSEGQTERERKREWGGAALQALSALSPSYIPTSRGTQRRRRRGGRDHGCPDDGAPTPT